MTKMAEDLIKKYGLTEAVKRMQKINEYTFYDSTMVEDDQDQSMEQQAPQDNQAPIDGGQEGMQMQQDGGEQPMNGGQGVDANSVGGNEQPMGDMQGDVQTEGGEVPQMGEAPTEDPNMMGGDEGFEDIEMDTEQPGDEVIDVDELTQSQETTEFKVDNVDDKLNKVLKVIEKFTDAIDANDQKIEDLKKEFQKRNPTAEETLNLRSMASYPYSEKPDEYWKKQQETHPNYRIMSDNDVSTADEQQEFEIRKSDIDNFNERDVLKSLGESHMKLSDFLQF